LLASGRIAWAQRAVSIWLKAPSLTEPNAVYQFRFNATNGTLSKNEPLTASPADGLEPRHLAFHPKLPIVYCDDEKGDSVTAYHFDRKSGQLKAFHTSSTLPADFDGGKNSCADIEITTDGKFVYASNRGHNSVAGFSVNSTDGKLTSIGQFATGNTPRSFNLSPDNQWVIAAGQKSNDLHVYKRSSATGKLTKQPTVTATGKNPSWVQFIPLR
jgi:6-phosphogluconolactonase